MQRPIRVGVGQAADSTTRVTGVVPLLVSSRGALNGALNGLLADDSTGKGEDAAAGHPWSRYPVD